MKKTLMSFALFVVLLFTVSANTERVYNAVNGINAPAFEVIASDGDSIVSLSDLKGRYVIVNFWASTDAESRIAAGQYSQFANSEREGQLALLSVNIDRNERLFREIVRRDGLKTETQFHVTPDVASDLIEKFDMSEGLQSFLIDPQGKIAAVNPTIQSLAKMQ